jgi:regulator of sirC expression with transglutaminase-like and TPR domain
LDRARKLEQQARQLRKLADSVHQRSVEAELTQLLARPEAEIDLAYAALLVARLDNDELDIAPYRRQLDHMAAEARAKLHASATPAQKLDVLRDYLFKECGFHGSRTDFYNRSNSYLNEVIDDREGLPITLSVLFLELAQRIGLTEVAATSMPGHMLVKFTPAEGDVKLIDVFDGGKFVTREEAAELAEAYAGSRLREEHLRAPTKKEIIARILRNLMAVTERGDAPESVVRYLDLIIAIYPESALERLTRGMLRLRSGDLPGARDDFKRLLDTAPPGLDLDRVAELYRSL